MAKKKRVRKPSDYSLAQLQELMETKASELNELKSRRAALQKELDNLDELIQETEGVGARSVTGGRKTAGMVKSPATKKKVTRKKKVARAQNKRSAKSYAEEILRNEPEGLTLDELADRVLEQGYKTNSANFSNTLYQSLYNDRKKGKTFKYSDKTGKWTVK